MKNKTEVTRKMGFDYIKMILEYLDNYRSYQDISEVLNAVNTINNMIFNYPVNYNRQVVKSVITKYQNEINYLRNIELKYVYSNKTSQIDDYQELLNIRHCLLRIGVLRFSKNIGEKVIEDEIIQDDATVLIILLKLIIKEITNRKNNT